MTLTFNAAFGVTPGYGHNNENADDDSLSRVGIAWQDAMREEFNQTGILASAVLSKATVVYPQTFGCPRGGETVIQAVGVLNPKYVKVDDAADWVRAVRVWKASVMRIVRAVKTELKQERVTLFFQDVDSFYYIED